MEGDTTDDRMLQFARASRNAFLVAIMESPSRAADLALRSSGRPPHEYNINEIMRSSLLRMSG